MALTKVTSGIRTLATDEVLTANINDDAVTTAKVLDDNVTTAKILDNNVTLAKMADGTQGGTLYYGASGAPTELAAGTSGYFLKTQGGSANPVWAAAGGANTPYFYASRTGSQSNQTSGTWAKYEGDDEIIDTDGDYDDSTNYRFTPTTAGKYMICFSAAYGSSTNAQRYVFNIYKNGSAYNNSRASTQAGMAGQEIWGYAAAILDMNGSSDYVEAYGFLESGANTTGFISYGAFYGWRLIE
jgi:hypothetical protein